MNWGWLPLHDVGTVAGSSNHRESKTMTSLTRIAAACGALLLATAAHAATQYTVIDLTALAKSSSGDAFAINASGAVTGSYWDGSAYQAYVYQAGAFTIPHGPAGYAPLDINKSGQTSGNTYDFSQYAVTTGWLVTGGTNTNLSTAPGALKGIQAGGLNDDGVVAGAIYTKADSGGINTVAGIYQGGSWTSIGTLKGDTDAAAFDISNNGVVIGASSGATQRGFRYSGGTMTALDSLFAGGAATPESINDAGFIVGGAEVMSGGQHAVSWTGTAIADLGTLGGAHSYGTGVNNFGAIVGEADTSGGKRHAFIDVGGTMMDLNSLVVGSMGDITYLQTAEDINDSGWIVGEGILADGFSQHAFLLVPVPEPATWAMMLLALPAIGFAARRRQRRD